MKNIRRTKKSDIAWKSRCLRAPKSATTFFGSQKKFFFLLASVIEVSKFLKRIYVKGYNAKTKGLFEFCCIAVYENLAKVRLIRNTATLASVLGVFSTNAIRLMTGKTVWLQVASSPFPPSSAPSHPAPALSHPTLTRVIPPHPATPLSSPAHIPLPITVIGMTLLGESYPNVVSWSIVNSKLKGITCAVLFFFAGKIGLL